MNQAALWIERKGPCPRARLPAACTQPPALSSGVPRRGGMRFLPSMCLSTAATYCLQSSSLRAK